MPTKNLRVASIGLAAAAVGIAAALAAQAPPLVRSHLVWLDRSGKSLGILGDLGDYGDLELSRDGRRVAVALLDQTLGTRDIWMIDVADGRRTRFTSSPADENWLIFSPDGKRVMFNAFSREAIELREAAADGSGGSTVVLADTAGVWPVSWSPDGRHLVFVRNDESTGNDVWVLPLFGDRKAFPLFRTRGTDNWAAVSPDGHWIAYSSNEAGDLQVYVSKFPEGGRKWLVSADGGSQARWRRDGKELFYLAPDKTVMAVTVTSGRNDFEVGEISRLFPIDLPYFPYHAFDVAADGQRFIVNTVVVASGRPGTPARSAGWLLDRLLLRAFAYSTG